MKVNKKGISLSVLVITIIVIFILLASIVVLFNNVATKKQTISSKYNEQENKKVGIDEIKDNLVFNIEKETYNSIENILYYAEDFWANNSKEKIDIIKKDLSKIVEYLKNEKNGIKILINFKYITDEQRVYSGVQLINGYKVKQTTVTFKIKEDNTIEALPFSVADFNNKDKLVVDDEMEDIVINYLASYPEVYYESISDKGIEVTCYLTTYKKDIYWMVLLNGSNKLKVYPNGRVEYVKIPEINTD